MSILSLWQRSSQEDFLQGYLLSLIHSYKPFAIVLPISAGTITFYDVNGNTVEYWNNSLGQLPVVRPAKGV